MWDWSNHVLTDMWNFHSSPSFLYFHNFLLLLLDSWICFSMPAIDELVCACVCLCVCGGVYLNCDTMYSVLWISGLVQDWGLGVQFMCGSFFFGNENQ